MAENQSLSCAARASTQVTNADLLTGDTLPLYNAAVPKFPPAPGSTTPAGMLLVPQVYAG